MTALGDLNRAILQDVSMRLDTARDEVSCLGGGGDRYYVRTAAIANRLPVLRGELNRCVRGEAVKEAAGKLASEIKATLSAPALLSPGAWPSGGAQAGVPPQPNDGVSDPDIDPSGGQPGQCTAPGGGGGIER